MRRLQALVLLPLLLGTVACVSPGDWADGDYIGPTSSKPEIQAERLGDGAFCGYDGCSTAVGGTNTMIATTYGSADVEAAVTNDFAITQTSTFNGPYTIYDLRAPGNEARASLSISIDGSLPETFEVAAHAIYDISIVAPSRDNAYSRDFYQVPASSPRFVVALWSDEDSSSPNRAYEPSRLIDTSMSSASANVEQLAWDTFEIAGGPGVYSVEFVSDALGSVELQIEVVDG